MKYEVIANDATTFYALDIILERWKSKPKKFPYDQPGALIPQNLIPEKMRGDKEVLFNFYFFICLYMRGGIESAQAFRAMLRLWEDMPELFEPTHTQHLKQDQLQPIVAKYIGWDSKAVSRFWIENSKRLVRSWGGRASNLFKGLDNYEEALRRIQNKDRKSKTVRIEADAIDGDGHGFMGFQPKMVSMIVYFIDWEDLLEESFIYPTPADFHNFRFGLAIRGLVISPQPKHIRSSEKLSKVWRDLTIRYLKARKGTVTPVELADAIWLFSLQLCGNSPLTVYYSEISEADSIPWRMFKAGELSHRDTPDFLARQYRNRLYKTCLACPLNEMCELSIPASPYYQRREGRKEAFGGQLYLIDRFPIEWHLPVYEVDYMPQHEFNHVEEQVSLFSFDE